MQRQHAIRATIEDDETRLSQEAVELLRSIAITVVMLAGDDVRERLDPAPAVRQVPDDEDAARTEDSNDLGETSDLCPSRLAHVLEHADGCDGVEGGVREREPHGIDDRARDEAVAGLREPGDEVERLE